MLTRNFATQNYKQYKNKLSQQRAQITKKQFSVWSCWGKLIKIIKYLFTKSGRSNAVLCVCVCVLKRSENVKIQEKLKVAVHFAHSTTNQKYYPDLGPSSLWNLYPHSSNLMSFHCQCWHHKVLNYCFSGHETQHYFIMLQIIHVNGAAFI